MAKKMSILTDEEIEKVQDAFFYDLTPFQVAADTGIDYERILNWLSVDANLHRINLEREKAEIGATKVITDSAVQNKDDAKWYLERRNKKKWAPKTYTEDESQTALLKEIYERIGKGKTNRNSSGSKKKSN